jgi:hypothetical protein
MTTLLREPATAKPLEALAHWQRWVSRLRRGLRGPLGVAWLLGLVQFAILVVEEQAVWSRGELTYDYQIFARAYALIGPGRVLDPAVYLGGAPNGYIRNHFELITWPLAWLLVGLLHLPVHVVLLDLLQALPTAVIGPLAALWASRVADERGLGGWRRWVVVVTPAVLALLDIWLYWADSFDFHYQALETALMVGTFVALRWRRPKLAALLLGILALMGDTASLVIAGVGVVAGVEGWQRRSRERRWWLFATGALALAGVTLVVPGLLHDNLGSVGVLRSYQALVGSRKGTLLSVVASLPAHPLPALARLYRRRWDVWALVGGSGVLGVAWYGALGIMIAVGVPIWLAPLLFGYAGLFQSVPVVGAILLGSAYAIAGLAARRSVRVVMTLVVGSVLMAAAWLGVFSPELVMSIRDVSQPANGASLRLLAERAPRGAEVLTTNGSAGTPAEFGELVEQPDGCPPSLLPIDGRPVQLVIEPWRGFQFCSPAALLAAVASMQRLVGARLQGPLPGGVYAVEWMPGPYRGTLVLPPAMIPGQDLAGLSSMGLRTGPAIPASEGGGIGTPAGGGFVLEGLTAWLQPHEQGVALVRLQVTGQAQVQVFDDATGELLARRYVDGVGESATLRLAFRGPRYVPPHGVFSDGVGLIRTTFVPPLRVDPVELRVWVPPGTNSIARVSSVWIGPSSEAPQP